MGARTIDTAMTTSQAPSTMRKDNRSDEEKNKLLAFVSYDLFYSYSLLTRLTQAKNICEDYPYKKYPPDEGVIPSLEHTVASDLPVSPILISCKCTIVLT